MLFSLLDPAITTSPQTEELFDLIASSQSRRLDDQRVNVGNLPGLRITHNNLGHLVGEGDHQEPSDDFFNMLIKCQVRPQSFIARSQRINPLRLLIISLV